MCVGVRVRVEYLNLQYFSLVIVCDTIKYPIISKYVNNNKYVHTIDMSRGYQISSRRFQLKNVLIQDYSSNPRQIDYTTPHPRDTRDMSQLYFNGPLGNTETHD